MSFNLTQYLDDLEAWEKLRSENNKHIEEPIEITMTENKAVEERILSSKKELEDIKVESERILKRMRDLEIELESLTKKRVEIGSVRKYNVGDMTNLMVITGISGYGDHARVEVIRIISERTGYGQSLRIVPESHNLDGVLSNTVDLPSGKEEVIKMIGDCYGRMFPSCSLVSIGDPISEATGRSFKPIAADMLFNNQ